MIIGIVAVDRKGAIGKGGQLPWHYSADMKFFREVTTGHACVMGYNTWLTLQRPLKERLNIVLSRRALIAPQDSLMVLRDLTSVLSLAPYLSCELFVIGGQKVYQAFLPFIQKWIVTQIPMTVEGADAFVPENYLAGFQEMEARLLAENLTVKFYSRAN